MQRHEVQPDVYCGRLNLQVPVAVSVKDGQMADLFHVICGIALKPYVLPSILPHFPDIPRSLSAIPGGADRALSSAARLRVLVTWTAVLGGLSESLMMIYRTLLRPNGVFGSWGSSWTTWVLGRREL